MEAKEKNKIALEEKVVITFDSFIGIVKEISEGSVNITWEKGGSSLGISIDHIFLATDHVIRTSKMIEGYKDKFDEKIESRFDATPEINNKFQDYWINMCKAENNEEEHKMQEVAFSSFFVELMEKVKEVCSVKIHGIPIL